MKSIQDCFTLKLPNRSVFEVQSSMKSYFLVTCAISERISLFVLKNGSLGELIFIFVALDFQSSLR